MPTEFRVHSPEYFFFYPWPAVHESSNPEGGENDRENGPSDILAHSPRKDFLSLSLYSFHLPSLATDSSGEA